MREYFFQAILSLVGVFFGALGFVLKERGKKILFICSGVAIVLVAIIWAGYEWGIADKIQTAQIPTQIAETFVLPSDTPTQSTPTIELIPSPLKPTNTFVPASTMPPVVSSGNGVIYDFETDSAGWGSSEGGYKPVLMESSGLEASSGSRSLLVRSQLSTKEEIFTHTEATSYFSAAIPGMDMAGPYDLNGKRIACDVYFEDAFPMTERLVSVRIFVKDDGFHNQYGEEVFVDGDIIGKWKTLSLLIGNAVNTDADFNPARTFAVGIRVFVLAGAPLDGEFSFFIDNCRIENQ